MTTLPRTIVPCVGDTEAESNAKAAASRKAWADDEVDRHPAPLTRAEAVRLRPLIRQVSPWRVVAVQLAAGLLCVGGAGLVTRSAVVAWSAAYGAAAVVLSSAVLARGMTRPAGGAVAAAAGFLVWELAKIGVAVAMLLIAAHTVPGLSWPALLLTMAVCMKVNWVALLWRQR